MKKVHKQYTKEDLGYILYNNRSIENAFNFTPDINIFHLLQIEKILNRIHSKYNNGKFISINTNDFDLDALDIILEPGDIKQFTDLLLKNHQEFKGEEREYLKQRGISDDIINEYKLSGISQITDSNIKEILGIKLHPSLTKILKVSSLDKGVIIPLFNDKGELINVTTRSMNTDYKLKYSQAIPETHIWGEFDGNKEIWIGEGIFDMMALRSLGVSAYSVSSAMWSVSELVQLLEHDIKFINIVSDNDQTGYRSALIMSEFFNAIGIDTKIWSTPNGKDAADHIFLEKKTLEDFIDITDNIKDLLEQADDDSYNFLRGLKDREYE